METAELETTDTDALDAFRAEDFLGFPEAFEAFARGEFDVARETEDDERRAA